MKTILYYLTIRKMIDLSTHLTTERYKWVMHRLNELNAGEVRKTSKDNRFLSHMNFLLYKTVQGTVVHNLIKPGTNLVSLMRSCLMLFTIYTYASVKKEVLQLYTNLCKDCQLKKAKLKNPML